MTADGDALLRRYFAEQLIAARHKRCGKLAAVYLLDAGGGYWHREPQCRCSAAPTLPAGAVLSDLVAKAQAAERNSSYRARLRIYV